MSDLFYAFGIALVVMALVISFFGLRSERFPDSRGIYAAVLGLMVALVVAACGFAIALAREEADHRQQEFAEFEAEQAEEEAATAAEDAETEPAGTEPPVETEQPKVQTLDLTSPETGDLLFEPAALEAQTGEISIEYTNPSETPHNVAIEGDGQEIAQGATVAGGETGTATAALEPGEYIYFCSIPGHRESGMEGTLTVE